MFHELHGALSQSGHATSSKRTNCLKREPYNREACFVYFTKHHELLTQYRCIQETAAQPAMEAQLKPSRRESASTTLVQDKYMPFDEQRVQLTT